MMYPYSDFIDVEGTGYPVQMHRKGKTQSGDTHSYYDRGKHERLGNRIYHSPVRSIGNRGCFADTTPFQDEQQDHCSVDDIQPEDFSYDMFLAYDSI
jgi:hypothetical protein